MPPTCPRCRERERHWYPRGYYSGYCIPCERERQREIPPAVRKHRVLKTRFGLSLDAYEALLDSQKGVCAICRKPPTDRALAVDHDHTTGRIRGLLCNRCNTTLGLMDDSRERLLAAADYLAV